MLTEQDDALIKKNWNYVKTQFIDNTKKVTNKTEILVNNEERRSLRVT